MYDKIYQVRIPTHVHGSPSGYDWLEIPGVPSAEEGGKTLFKTKEKTITHRASKLARNTDQSRRIYSLVTWYTMTYVYSW